MKILLTTHVFVPEFCGGTETLVHNVALTLRQCGHAVLILTGYPDIGSSETGDRFDEYEFDSFRVVRFRYQPISIARGINAMRNDYDNPNFSAGFRRLLREFAPDIVHFYHLGRLSIKAVDACTEANIPAFLTITDFWPICPTQAMLLPDGKICGGQVMAGANCLKHIASISQSKSLSKMINMIPINALSSLTGTLKRANFELPGTLGVVQALGRRNATIASRFPLLKKVFVPTGHTKAMLERSGLNSGNFHVLPFGIADHGYLKRIRARSEGDLILGFIGQFLPHKGLHVLIEAIRLLPASCSVQIKVYGNFSKIGTQYSEDLRLLGQSDDRIRFCGSFENARIPTVLDEMDALVIPSLWPENMPLVSLSAQAAGCPVIASDVGGLSEIIVHGKNGLLFAPGSSSDLRDRILQLLADNELLTQLSNAAVTPLNMIDYVNELECEYLQAGGESN